jgi:hypothetical protein
MRADDTVAKAQTLLDQMPREVNGEDIAERPFAPPDAYQDEAANLPIQGPNGTAQEDNRIEPLKLYTLDEFVQRPTVSSHVRGIIPSKSIVVVFGPPKGGKTFSVCDLTMHAAHGLDWHGCTIAHPLKVAYLVGEGVTGFRVRLKAWLEHHDTLDKSGLFRILPRSLALPACVLALVETLRAFSPDIIVTDTLNAYFSGGDENSTKDMSAFCNAIRYLRDQLACSVVVIHHTGHGDSGRERGSIVLRATADVLIQVAKDETAGQLVGFQVIAARDLEPMESAIPLKLARHETEWLDADGDPLVSCVVEAGHESVTLPGRGGKPLGEAQSIVLAAAMELTKGIKPDDGEVFIAHMDVQKLAKERGVSPSTISMTWARLERRGFWPAPGCTGLNALRKIAPTGIAPLEARGF